MPMYEFKCNKCGNIFSELRSISETDPAKCTKCESIDTKKMMSSFATGGSSSKVTNCTPTGGG